jgi:hypothetical protein
MLAGKTTWLPLDRLSISVNTALQGDLATAHRLDGAASTDGEMAVLGFRLTPESRFIPYICGGRDELPSVCVVPQIWCSHDGFCLLAGEEDCAYTTCIFEKRVARPVSYGSRQISVRLLRRLQPSSLLRSTLRRALERSRLTAFPLGTSAGTFTARHCCSSISRPRRGSPAAPTCSATARASPGRSTSCCRMRSRWSRGSPLRPSMSEPSSPGRLREQRKDGLPSRWGVCADQLASLVESE